MSWSLASGTLFHVIQKWKSTPFTEAEAKFLSNILTKGHNDDDSPIRAGYYLNGKSFVRYSDLAFNASISLLFRAFGLTQQLQQIMKYIDKDTEAAYYGDTIAMLGFLQAEVPY